MQYKQSKRGSISLIATSFIPIAALLFYLNLLFQEISYNRTIFENATRQTALAVARQRIQQVSIGDQYTYLSRVAITTFNDFIKVKTGLKSNLFTISNTPVQYGLVRRVEYDNYSSTDSGYNSHTQNRHALFILNKRDDFSNDYEAYSLDPDVDQTIDSGFLGGNTDGYMLTNRQYESAHTTKIMCTAPSVTRTSNTIDISDSNSNSIKIVDSDGVISVEITARFGKYNKQYKATYKSIAPQLNTDIVLSIPINSSASDAQNTEYPTADQINNIYAADYKETAIWQTKEGLRNFIKNMLSYRNCAVGIIPYCGTVNLPGCSSSSTTIPDIRTQLFPRYDYQNYDTVNPQISISEGFKYGAFESNGIVNLGDQDVNINYIPGSHFTYTPVLYRADMNQPLEDYMQNGEGGSKIEQLLYALVVGSEAGTGTNETIFMARALDMNAAGDLNILAGYSKRSTAVYPTPYPMYGLSQKLIDLYRYLAIFAPFLHHNNASHFLYLPIMFGASMLKNNYLSSTNYQLNISDETRKKVLILISNKNDTFAPHELTYFGLSNDASCITLVNGDKIDFTQGVYVKTTQTDVNDNTITTVTGTLEIDSSGYYRNKIFTADDYGTSIKDGNLESIDILGMPAGVFHSNYEQKVQISSNYLYKADEHTDGTYSLRMPQPGNLKIVVSAQTDLTNAPYAKVFVNNNHQSGVTISDVSTENSTIQYTTDANGDYYQCRAMSSNTTSDLEMALEQTQLRTNPVLAQIELSGCEIDSITKSDGTSDSHYVFRQDENYVYICYDSASENPTAEAESNMTKIILKIKQSNTTSQYPALSYSDKSLTASDSAVETYSPNNASTSTTQASIAFSAAYTKSYQLGSTYNVIFIPRAKLTGNDLSFTLKNAKVLSIEWSNHLNGIEGCYACDDTTGNNSKLNATQLAVYYEPITPGKNCRWASTNKKGSGGESSLPWFHEHIGVETATNYGAFSWSSDSRGYANTETASENYLYIAGSSSADIATIRLHSDEPGSGYENSSTHGDFHVILNNVNNIPYINVWFAKSDGTHVDEHTYISGVGRYCQAEHRENMTGTSDESQLSMALTDSNQKLRLADIECTNEVNRILMAIGAQTCSVSTTQHDNDLPNKSPSKALQDTVTPEMIKKFNEEIPNGRIYVIHYRKDGQETPQEIDNVYKNYYVKDLETMNAILCEILSDIEAFAEFTDAQIVE